MLHLKCLILGLYFHVMLQESWKPCFTPFYLSAVENLHVSLRAEVKKEAEEGDEPRAETESESEEELSCFAPTVWNEKLVNHLNHVDAPSFGKSAQQQLTPSDPISGPFGYFSRNVSGPVTSTIAFQGDCLTRRPRATRTVTFGCHIVNAAWHWPNL